MKYILIFLLSSTFLTGLSGQSETAMEVMQKVQDKVNGKTSLGTMRMTVVRPKWSRTMEMKSWSSGNELALILVTTPARDKGTAFLKRENEIWNWQPRIDRTIKLPPSMMTQSWMGSDFTNDDLVRESSIVEDYTHKFIGEEVIDGRMCHKIELIPHEDAAVVWGKVVSWIDKEEYIQIQVEFFDEDGYLVNTMYGREVKNLGGKLLPSILEMIPADKEGHKTIVEQLDIVYDQPIPDSFFSIQNMKRVR